MIQSSSAPPRSRDRTRWHRLVNLLPLAYLVAIVAIAVVHPFLPSWRWLLIHLLLLGAVSNAILVWGAHFAAAVLRVPAPLRRRMEAARLGLLNVGTVVILVAGVAGQGWLGVGGATAVFVAVLAHLWTLARWMRRSLPARFAVTVRYYLVGAVALLSGIPVGAWMLAADTNVHDRMVLFHAHVNVLGWIGLTVLGTLLTLWPTVLRTRMPDGAVRAAVRALPLAAAGLAVLGGGLLAWWPAFAVVGLALFGTAVVVIAVPAVVAARQRRPASFAAWSIAAAVCWLLVALVRDGVGLVNAVDPAAALGRFDAVLLPLLVGFAAQVLLGALAHLLPVALGGGPESVRARRFALDRHWPQRVVTGNIALAVFLLPVGSYVRITTSMLVLVALVQFLAPAIRVLLVRGPVARSVPAVPWARPLGGVAGGLALVLLAVVGGVVAQQANGPGLSPALTHAATGRTTTITVIARGMRFHPDRIEVPAGDRLVIEVINHDERRHDLVLANGARTASIARGSTARLDAGVITETIDGWCSLPGHRQQGMVLTIIAIDPGDEHPTEAPPVIDALAEPGADFRPRAAALTPAGNARVHRITLRIQEVEREVAPGVRQKLWTFNGTAPGPVFRGRIGDVFEVTLINDGTVDHGIDFHAGALAPDRPMRPIDPGESLVYRFTATKAGIWMYHCSTMPMLHHIGNGMYGAIIIDPPDLPAVHREYVLVQSELYLGPPGEPGDLAKMQAERPDAVVFNGYVAQYTHRPLTARVGERVRIWLLNAGPNRPSAFHVVGVQFDTVYREGRWELRHDDSGAAQVLHLVPAAGGFVETVFPEAGTYPFVTHVMVDAERGARGFFQITD